MAAQTIVLDDLPGHSTTLEVVDGWLHHRTTRDTADGPVLVCAAAWRLPEPRV